MHRIKSFLKYQYKGEALLDPYFVLALVTGAALGSFLNVVIHRMPQHILNSSNLSPFYLAYPGSTTPCCHQPIVWHHKIPILSWIFLFGKCAKCRHPIKGRYLIVETTTAMIFGGLYIYYGLQEITFFYMGFTLLATAMFWIDLEEYLLPNELTYILLWLGLLGSALDILPTPSSQAIWAVIFGFLLMWGINFLYFIIRKKDGFGGGDLKLVAALGAWTGIMGIPMILGLASIFGLLTTLLVYFVGGKKMDMTTAIPFGPFLILAGVLVIAVPSVKTLLN